MILLLFLRGRREVFGAIRATATATGSYHPRSQLGRRGRHVRRGSANVATTLAVASASLPAGWETRLRQRSQLGTSAIPVGTTVTVEDTMSHRGMWLWTIVIRTGVFRGSRLPYFNFSQWNSVGIWNLKVWKFKVFHKCRFKNVSDRAWLVLTGYL